MENMVLGETIGLKTEAVTADRSMDVAGKGDRVRPPPGGRVQGAGI